MLMRYLRFIFVIIAALLPTVVFAQDATPTPTPVPPPQVLNVWLPDALVLPNNEISLPLVQSQTEDFTEQRDNTIVNLRVKEVNTPGGIMPALRTGSLVAPSAMPSITLLRRQDLVTAQANGLITTIEGLIPTATISQLDATLALGQINSRLYGLPYTIDLLHVAYRPQDDVDYSLWDYSSVIERNENFYFPAGTNASISNTLLLQYLADGGALDEERLLLFDERVLLNILEFYERVTDDGLLDGLVMNYTSPQSYLNDFANGDVNTAVLTSTNYLQLASDSNDLAIAPIPTESGETTTILNGWMWVIVASDPQQRALAIEYISWMMEAERQATFAASINQLPSQQNALTLELSNRVDIEPYLEMLDNAFLPTTESEGGTIARLMQDALSQVVTGQRTAEDAVNAIINR